MAFNAGAPSGNLILIQKQIASSSSSLTFTTGITSAYDNYYLFYYGVKLTASPGVLNLQPSTNGGSSYDSTHSTGWGAVTTAGGLAGTGYLNASIQLVSFSQTSSSETCSGYLILYSLASSTLTKNFIVADSEFQNSNGRAFVSVGGEYSVTSAVNAFQIVPNSGTFSGTFKFYGIQN